MATKTRKKKNQFLDNKEFYSLLVSYRERCDKAKKLGKEKPRIPDKIGKCFLTISEHLAMRPNFSNYIFKDDMIMDAVENMVVCASNFDPNKSKNPFSYFTQVAWYAFIRRIGKEKKQIAICDKIIERSGFDTFFEGAEGGSSSDYNTIVNNIDQKTRQNRKERSVDK